MLKLITCQKLKIMCLGYVLLFISCKSDTAAVCVYPSARVCLCEYLLLILMLQGNSSLAVCVCARALARVCVCSCGSGGEGGDIIVSWY